MQSDQDPIPVKAITLTQHALHLCCLLTAGLLLSACKPEAKVAEGGDPTGIYALVSVNGNKVPASVSHDGTALQVRSGTFTIKADGTCSTKTVFVWSTTIILFHPVASHQIVTSNQYRSKPSLHPYAGPHFRLRDSPLSRQFLR